MTAEIVKHDGEYLTIQVKVKITGSLFEAEQAILDACNEVGTLATSHTIKKFDTDGSPIQVAGVKLTAKQPVPKIYQTPYGAVEVPRYVYQTAKGGKTYCPLEPGYLIKNLPNVLTSQYRCLADSVELRYIHVLYQWFQC